MAALLAWWLTGLYVRTMNARRRLEPLSERGMHTVPVPTGAGIAIVAAALILWPISNGLAFEGQHIMLLAALAALAAISWIDDCYRLSPAARFVAHILVIAPMLASLEPELRVLSVLPLGFERVLLGLAWLWFINLFNFMDGIDGLAGAEAIAVAVGYVAVVAAVGLDDPLQGLALVVAAATAGYLFWNWHPAKVFMGDAGSIPLGFLLGWLMIQLACRGYWAPAVILPLYFAADATLTLLKRLLRGEKPWVPHREHFYQRAVMSGTRPSVVVARASAVNVALIALALLSIGYPALAVTGAIASVAGLLIHLERLAGRGE